MLPPEVLPQPRRAEEKDDQCEADPKWLWRSWTCILSLNKVPKLAPLWIAKQLNARWPADASGKGSGARERSKSASNKDTHVWACKIKKTFWADKAHSGLTVPPRICRPLYRSSRSPFSVTRIKMMPMGVTELCPSLKSGQPGVDTDRPTGDRRRCRHRPRLSQTRQTVSLTSRPQL